MAQEAKAALRFLHISPQKVRRVAAVVRGSSVAQALSALAQVPQRSAPPLRKLLLSALSNARVLGLEEDNLVIRHLTVNEGSVFKRSLPRAHGRATPIRRRTSHITIVLGI